MKILGTGLSGLVGSRIVELLKNQYEFDSSEVDITNRDSIIEKIKSSDASIVLHLAAKTDVDGCEKDREQDIRGLSLRGAKNERRSNPQRLEIASLPSGARNDRNGVKTAWAVNVVGTQNVADACQLSKKKLIYISTDFVFDGTKEAYNEDNVPSPINWYGKTKYEGEKIIQNLSTPWLIVRIAYPYRASFMKLDFFRAILKRLQMGQAIAGVTDHIFTPTFVDDIAIAIDGLIKQNEEGLFHAVGSQSLSPFEAAQIISRAFNCDQKLISKTTRNEFFRDRAPRPFQLALKNDKIQRLGIKMRTFEEGLKELKSQMSNLKSAS